MTINNTTIPNVVYPVANAGVSTNPFVDIFNNRPPTGNDTNYPVQKKWFDTSTGDFYLLEGFTSTGGVIQATWVVIGGTSGVQSLTGNTGGAVYPTANNTDVVGDGVYLTVTGNPGTSTLTISPAGGLTTLYTEDVGTATPMAGNLNILGGTGVNTVGSGDTVTINASASVPLTFTANSGSATPAANNLNIFGGTGITTVGSGSTITINATAFAVAYTNVTNAMSPYTVLTTDEYISVDCSAGPVTLRFPNAPTATQTWIVKDRTGNSNTNNITITTPGGVVTFDGGTSYVINTNYESINLLANATPTYEIF